jgi:hypothetical protein
MASVVQTVHSSFSKLSEQFSNSKSSGLGDFCKSVSSDLRSFASVFSCCNTFYNVQGNYQVCFLQTYLVLSAILSVRFIVLNAHSSF